MPAKRRAGSRKSAKITSFDPSATPSTTSRPVTRLDALFGVFRYARLLSSPPTATDADNNAVVMTDRRIVRVTGPLVHSDILSKVLWCVGESIQGLHVKTIRIGNSYCYSIAVNSTETLMATGGYSDNLLRVYSLPAGKLLKTIGGRGSGAAPGQFNCPYRLCFTGDASLLVCDFNNNRLQEFTSSGENKRSIPISAPETVCCNGRMIAVVSCRDSHEITLFDYVSGAVIRKLEAGVEWGCWCTPRFTADGTGLITPINNRVSLFSVGDGSLVRTMCVGLLMPGGCKDIELARNGEIIVADYAAHRVLIFDADGSSLVRSFGGEGGGDGQFNAPTALSLVNGHLYVLDFNTPRVQVFE